MNKIYTKQGDQGKTSLIGGERVDKYDDRVEAYGTVDELHSHIGHLYDLSNEGTASNKTLLKILNDLFIIESRLAAGSIVALETLPALKANDITILENEIDKMTPQLPAIKGFILPCGHPLASKAHIARSVCRRAERLTLKSFHHKMPDELILCYLNRLSDYLFTLARLYANKLGSGERLWHSN